MSILQCKSSLGYIWYTVICFLIQIYCHVNNLRIIRFYDSSIEDKSKETSVIICLIIVAFTVVGSSISTVLSFLYGFGNSIEDDPLDLFKSNQKKISLPWLTLFDIHIALFILLPKIIIDTQLIKAKIKDDSYVFETSIDFLIGNGISRVKKDDLSMIKMDLNNSSSSCEIINLFLILIRFHFCYSNRFYKLNIFLSIIMSIHSIISIIFSIITFSTFELLFKQISIINNSINIYSYLLISSLMISILLILLTNHSLFHFSTQVYFEEQYKISNQLIRLSNLDDRYLISRSICRSLIFYFLFVILTLTSQLPFIVLTSRFLFSGLIDNLYIIYLIIIILFSFISISLFTFFCLFPSSSWNFHNLNQYWPRLKRDQQSVSSRTFQRSIGNVEEKLFHIGTPHQIPTRSVSSSGLTVIDNEYLNGGHSHPTFQQTPGVATDALLVMH